MDLCRTKSGVKPLTGDTFPLVSLQLLERKAAACLAHRPAPLNARGRPPCPGLQEGIGGVRGTGTSQPFFQGGYCSSGCAGALPLCRHELKTGTSLESSQFFASLSASLLEAMQPAKGGPRGAAHLQPAGPGTVAASPGAAGSHAQPPPPTPSRRCCRRRCSSPPFRWPRPRPQTRNSRSPPPRASAATTLGRRWSRRPSCAWTTPRGRRSAPPTEAAPRPRRRPAPWPPSQGGLYMRAWRGRPNCSFFPRAAGPAAWDPAPHNAAHLTLSVVCFCPRPASGAPLFAPAFRARGRFEALHASSVGTTLHLFVPRPLPLPPASESPPSTPARASQPRFSLRAAGALPPVPASFHCLQSVVPLAPSAPFLLLRVPPSSAPPSSSAAPHSSVPLA